MSSDPSRPNFSHLRRLHANTGMRVWLELPDVSPGAAIEGIYAGVENKGLQAGEMKARPIVGRSAEAIQMALEQKLDLYARHVLVGWRGVLDAENRAVEFSPDAASEFLRQLPFDIVRRICNFFETRTNFTEAEDPRSVAKELGGN